MRLNRRDVEQLLDDDQAIGRLEEYIKRAIALWIAIGTLALGLMAMWMGR